MPKKTSEHISGNFKPEDDSKRAMDQSEQIAKENASHTSNGNRTESTSGKPGGAERGGPDREKAQERQPPDATFPFRNG